MHAFKSWFFSGGSWFILGGLWLFTWLLGFTNSNASSSVWMLPLALLHPRHLADGAGAAAKQGLRGRAQSVPRMRPSGLSQVRPAGA